ncbi:T9SS type A sorting domain-containing protein, partial [Hyunsoonleella flava]
VDNDSDTYFGSVTSVTACEQPVGYSLTAPTADDCDDNDPNEFPGQTWYIGVDNDSDTYFGSVTSVTACEQPVGYSLTAPTADDCDDNDPNEFPGQTWYIGVDNDSDTYFGSVTSVTACEQPVGYSLTAPTADDCDDADDTIYPGAPEITNDGIDQDCDGFDQTTLDRDKLEFRNIAVTPNPFGDNINIALPLSYNNTEFSIQIFDMNGRLVIDRQYSNSNNKIKVNGLDKLDQAPYIIKIINTETGFSMMKQLIKF